MGNLFNRGGVISGLRSGLANVAQRVVDTMDTTDKPLAERIEKACYDIFASDPRVNMLLNGLEATYKVPQNTLYVVPMFKDDTLLVSGYALCINGEILVEGLDFLKLKQQMKMYMLTDNTSEILGFQKHIDSALQKR